MVAENLVLALAGIAAFDTLALMIVGVAAGLLAGAIPGFTIAMAVVLTLPFTFSMDPAQGLATMVEQLRELVGQTRQRAGHIAAATEQFAGSVGNAHTKAGDISGTIAEVSRSAANQQALLGDVTRLVTEIASAIEGASTFVSIGTSGQVYPAAGFVAEARSKGAKTIELNLEPSAVSDLFDENRHGPASEIVPRFVAELLGGDV